MKQRGRQSASPPHPLKRGVGGLEVDREDEEAGAREMDWEPEPRREGCVQGSQEEQGSRGE